MRLALFTVSAAVALGVGLGCRRPLRPAPAPAVAGVAADERYCWWAVFRTYLPPDTVAARFVRAFSAVGLSGGSSARVADTAWARAGPSVVRTGGAGTYEARVVAYRKGDSTHFRYFVAGPPGKDVIGFCQAMGMAAAVHGTAPPEPDGEEKLDVWRRRR